MFLRKAITTDSQQLVKKLTEFDDYLKPLFSKGLEPFVTYKNIDKTFEEVVKEWLHNPKYILFVAEDKGNIIGHICGTIKERKFHIKDNEGSIEEWFVSKEYRNKGIGKQLYQTLLEEFKKAECTHITLKVFADNKDAIDMYHAMGFLDLELTLIQQIY